MRRPLKRSALAVGALLLAGTPAVALMPKLRHRMIREIRWLVKLHQDNRHEILPAPNQPRPAAWRDDQLTAAWLGHATMLVNFYGVWLLTDPVFSDHAGPNLGPLAVGPKRYVAPALPIEALPKLDLILVSHAHFDHLDTRSLARLGRRNPQAVAVTASRTADLLANRGFAATRELAWGESAAVTAGGKGPLTVTALPVRHWGARWRRDTYRGFNGYLLEYRGRRVVFSGDTALTPGFASLAAGGGVDLFFIGIGAYDPWIASHCNPEEAALMARQAGARHVFPMHFATFKLSDEPPDEPLRRFRAALPAGQLAGAGIGDTFVLP